MAPAAMAGLIEIDGVRHGRGCCRFWVLVQDRNVPQRSAHPAGRPDEMQEEAAERRMEATKHWTMCNGSMQPHRISSAQIVTRVAIAVFRRWAAGFRSTCRPQCGSAQLTHMSSTVRSGGGHTASRLDRSELNNHPEIP